MRIASVIDKWKYAFLIGALAMPIVVFYMYKDTYLILYHSETEGFAKMWVAASFIITLTFTIAANYSFLQSPAPSRLKTLPFFINILLALFLVVALLACFIPTNWEQIKIGNYLHICYFERFSGLVALSIFIIDILSIKSKAKYFNEDSRVNRIIVALDIAVLLAVGFTLIIGEIVDGHLVIEPKIENAEPFTEGFVAGSIAAQIILANILFAQIMSQKIAGRIKTGTS